MAADPCVGHVSVVVEGSDGTLVFIAGDASYTQAAMLDGAVDGVSPMLPR